MKRTKYDLYDIDGTLTKPGSDLWFECAKTVAVDKNAFYADIQHWKKEKKGQKNLYTSSLRMMKKSILNTPHNFTGEDWHDNTKEITVNLINENRIFNSSIIFLKERLAKGITGVLSTTNIIDGAYGFLSALVEKDLLSEHELKKIIVSGTEVDWKNRDILHFNIAEEKIVGFSKKVGIPTREISNQVVAAFGDDPLGNDRGILSIAKHPFIIKNEINKKQSSNKSFKFIEWDNFKNFNIGR